MDGWTDGQTDGCSTVSYYATVNDGEVRCETGRQVDISRHHAVP